MRLSRALLLTGMLLIAVPSDAFQNMASPQMKAANELFNNQKWEEAAKAYEVITASEPNNALALKQARMSSLQGQSANRRDGLEWFRIMASGGLNFRV